MAVLDCSKSINKYFEEIAKIPHGSFKEEKIVDYIENFAKDLRLQYKRDAIDNIIVYKAASEGYENHAPVMLQGHVDMVNEKNQDSNHNFDTDPLDLYIEDGFLKARGTTLGADDGCGVVYMLAILADATLQHPPLDCVFTTQEEVGLIGAMHIKGEDIRAKRMIGLDSGDEKTVCISSSGGRRTIIKKAIVLEPVSLPTYRLFVGGLFGGHSGGEIHKERGNANKLLARTAFALIQARFDFQLVNIDGGLKENAICRESELVFASSTEYDKIKEIVKEVEEDLKEELAFSDAGVFVTVKKVKAATKAMNEADSKAIIDMLYIMPNGLLSTSMAIPGLSVASLNMGVIRMDDTAIKVYFSIRSPMVSMREQISNQLGCIATMFGASYEVKNDYPGWQYEKDSDLREKYTAFIKETEGFDIGHEATHGGLETGIFKGIIPSLDIITMGPDMYDIHTPKERLSIASFERCYERLTKFLAIL